MAPAWNEGEVVASMVDNIIKRVEYDNYSIFVGTYPNDPAKAAQLKLQLGTVPGLHLWFATSATLQRQLEARTRVLSMVSGGLQPVEARVQRQMLVQS